MSFDDLSFISGLDVDDYLSLRLLSNNDAEIYYGNGRLIRH